MIKIVEGVVMSEKLKKVFILLSGYLSFIAFAIVGGYVFVKSDSEELKKTAKLTLILTLIFTAINAVFLIYNHFGGFFGGYYSSTAYDIYSIIMGIVAIAEIIVYAVLIIMVLVKKEATEEKKIEE